ncbi:Uncharacterised protein [Vibrio cholerae]|uniref:Uncharacterized protein n=1 Tax=Vibrio cholerae TaxID=666 RepID=A0A655YIJ8_VIBCL|nr:Uncharacterised protein [Vibrio cholerae]CSC10198.1 Uncharacterised protein [Vibrio cholerae]CSC40164.1 Uncharacterised protein [Vibrio cholerae]CSI91330.1 Uncharacterised protein [Vibrio cholerae]
MDLSVNLLRQSFWCLKWLGNDITKRDMHTAFITHNALDDAFDIFKFTFFITALCRFLIQLARFCDVTRIVFIGNRNRNQIE